MKVQCGVYGAGWSHAYSTTLWKKSEKLEWVHNQTLPITFYVDAAIRDGVEAKAERKFFWMVESRDLFPGLVDWVKENSKKVSESCEALLTHCRELVGLEPNFFYMPPHGYWVENPQIYPKTKNISFLTSNKNWLPGHRVRLEWLNKLKDHCDVYGRGFNEVEKVEDAIRDYRFHVCIENNDKYFSEKILNAFACGAIPITIADREALGLFFDLNGIIFLDDSFDINSLTEELYLSKMEAIQLNLFAVRSFAMVEDKIVEMLFGEESLN